MFLKLEEEGFIMSGSCPQVFLNSMRHRVLLYLGESRYLAERNNKNVLIITTYDRRCKFWGCNSMCLSYKPLALTQPASEPTSLNRFVALLITWGIVPLAIWSHA